MFLGGWSSSHAPHVVGGSDVSARRGHTQLKEGLGHIRQWLPLLPQFGDGRINDQPLSERRAFSVVKS